MRQASGSFGLKRGLNLGSSTQLDLSQKLRHIVSDGPKHGADVVIRGIPIHVDAADAYALAPAGRAEQAADIVIDLLLAQLQHPHRAQAKIQERIRQVHAASSHVGTPTDIEKRGETCE